uniref:Uncharacterized protein n=1 Tax=Anopheles minimus TaxID=112268 RepID=A0A182WGW0_9DIPT
MSNCLALTNEALKDGCFCTVYKPLIVVEPISSVHCTDVSVARLTATATAGLVAPPVAARFGDADALRLPTIWPDVVLVVTFAAAAAAIAALQ